VSATITNEHWDKVMRYRDDHSLDSTSAALRAIIDRATAKPFSTQAAALKIEDDCDADD